MAKRSRSKRIGYVLLRIFCRLAAVTLFGFRCHGRSRMPEHGPVLICANHQSVLDPVIVGLCFGRRMNYLARRTLFAWAPFRWLIEFLDAIPIEREGLGIAGLKECLRRLKAGEIVLLFPEGTRTRDGEVQGLHPGFVVLARRAKVALLPMGIDGAYQAWPRTQRFPQLATIRVQVGEPLLPGELSALDDAQVVAEMERRVRDCHAAARRSRHDSRRSRHDSQRSRHDSQRSRIGS